MHQLRFGMRRLVIVTASMLMVQGLLIYGMPLQFVDKGFDPVRPYFPQVSALLIAGGVILTLLYRYPVPAHWRRALSVVPAAPLVLFSWLFSLSHGWSGVIFYGGMAAAVLVGAWLPHADSEQDRLDWGSICFGVIILWISLHMLRHPSSYVHPAYPVLLATQPWVSLSGIVGALVLLFIQFRRDIPGRSWLALYGAVFPLFLFTAMITAGIWTGVGWGLWALTYLLSPLQIRLPAPVAPPEGDEKQTSLYQLEKWMEIWAWFAIVALVALTAISGIEVLTTPFKAEVVIVALTLYNTVVHFFLPGVGSLQTRQLVHMVSRILAIAYVLPGAGPLGPSLLTLLATFTPLAARAAGHRAALGMFGFIVAVVSVIQVIAWRSGESLEGAMGVLLVEISVLSIAAWVTLTDVYSQERLVRDLGQSRAEVKQHYDELRTAHQDLQSTHEKLLAQEEELAGLNEALRTSEERFRSAFADAPIGMALVSAKGYWLQVNRALCEMLGYGEEELRLHRIAELIDPADLKQGMEAIEPLLSGKVRFLQLEGRFRHKDGHSVLVDQSVSNIQAPTGPHSYVLQIQDITDRKRNEERLLQLANHDPLTGLLNRRRFQEELESHLAMARRFQTEGALLFMDLDMFKYVNDTLGHQAGDELLRLTAALLRLQVRETDVVARLGGDEFAILMPHTGRDAAKVAERILAALRQQLVSAGGRSLSVTASIGITFFPEFGTRAEELLAQADMAMYQAKEQGRNTFVLFSRDDQRKEQMETKLSWERQIRQALVENRFVLHAQPVLDLRTNVVTRWELLLRMVGEDGQLIMPGTFLGIAERSGLIHEIDGWVVRQAIRLLAAEQEQGRWVIFEVNLSGKTISDPHLLQAVQEDMQQTGVDPSSLVLEITETAAISDLEQVRRFIDAMKGLGCRFALDDVGAGFSSLHLLKDLPIDYVKIDGSFIRNLSQDAADQHLVKALVAVAKELGKETIAEFVDKPETLELLREYGVDYAQGYLIGRPEARV